MIGFSQSIDSCSFPQTITWEQGEYNFIWEKNFEIGRILQLKSEIRNRKLDWPNLENRLRLVQSTISDFGFELQDLSNFKIPQFSLAGIP
jgi:hypothetical protein